jgi:hypothetical protein
MKFELADVYRPDKALDIKTWNFSADLQKFFGDLDNNEITDLLIKRRIVKKSQTDPESSCSYFYFTTKAQAVAFLKRLNATKEVANYEPPPPLPEELVAFDVNDWRKVRATLKKMLTAEQWQALPDVGVYELVTNSHGSVMFKAEIEAMCRKKVK